MDEIARQAGVSKTTVYRALSGQGRIGESTRRKVLDIAERTGYRPNRLARGLRRARTGLIGVVVPGIEGQFYARLLEGVEKALQDVDHRVLLTMSRGEREYELVESLLDMQVDGLIVASETDEPEFYTRLLERRVPIVFIDREVPGLHADLVATDHFQGGVLLGEHLRERGYRRPAFLSMTDSPRRIGSVEDRWCGFRSVFRNAALLEFPFVSSAERFQTDHPEAPQPETFSELCRQAVAGALEPLEGFPYDSVFAQYDHFALALIDALKAAGFRVPEEVGVVGFDDHDFTGYTEPSLTTIRQPLREIGLQAARRLLERIEEPDLPAAALRLPPRLIARRSSEPLAAKEQP